MSSGPAILVTSDFLGRGDQRLGSALAREFFRALVKREDDPPRAIIFINAGVRLLADGSNVLTQLQDLDARDVPIIACRSSAQHFDLEDKIEVGDTMPMAEILDLLMAGPVVSV